MILQVKVLKCGLAAMKFTQIFNRVPPDTSLGTQDTMTKVSDLLKYLQ